MVAALNSVHYRSGSAVGPSDVQSSSPGSIGIPTLLAIAVSVTGGAAVAPSNMSHRWMLVAPSKVPCSSADSRYPLMQSAPAV